MLSYHSTGCQSVGADRFGRAFHMVSDGNFFNFLSEKLNVSQGRELAYHCTHEDHTLENSDTSSVSVIISLMPF